MKRASEARRIARRRNLDLVHRGPAAHASVVAGIVRPVPHDLVQPEDEAVRLPTVLNPLERAHEAILADILGVHGVAEQRQRNGVRRAKVPAHQHVRRARVPATDGGDEVGVGRFSHGITHVHPPRQPGGSGR